jgi:ABC-type sugar transport system ATPase subunit
MSFGLRLAKTDKQIVDQKVRDAAEVLQNTEFLERIPKDSFYSLKNIFQHNKV